MSDKPEEKQLTATEQISPSAPEVAYRKLPVHADWTVRVVSLMTLLSGLVGVVQPLLVRVSEHPKLFSLVVPYYLYHWSRSLTVGFGLLLILLSVNLFWRKRAAWIVAFAISLASVALQVARIGSEHLEWVSDLALSLAIPAYSVVPSVVALTLLWITRKHFTVASERITLKEGVIRFVACILFAIIYGTVGFWLLDRRDFEMDFTFKQSVRRTLYELTMTGDPGRPPRTRIGEWFLDSLHFSGALLAFVAVYSLFRPVRYSLTTLPLERQTTQQILEKSGNNSLDFFKLLPDKSYFFSSTHNSVVAYKTTLNVAISLGDTVGPEDEILNTTKNWIEYCHNNGWTVAFLQTAPDLLEIYKRLGLSAVKVGEDAVVDLSHFCEKTVAKKSLKSVVRKFEKDGYTLKKFAPPHSEDLIDEVEAVSHEWLSLPGRRERGFSLGKFDRHEIQTHVLFAVESKESKIIAFVDQITDYRKGEATIDMMRHRVEVPGGTMDFLFCKLLPMLKEEGYTHFSLGLAALSGVGEKPDASMEEKAMHQIYEHMNRFFSYKGLRQYKSKFEPSWEERFLVYEGGPPGLIRTAIAIAHATEE